MPASAAATTKRSRTRRASSTVPLARTAAMARSGCNASKSAAMMMLSVETTLRRRANATTIAGTTIKLGCSMSDPSRTQRAAPSTRVPSSVAARRSTANNHHVRFMRFGWAVNLLATKKQPTPIIVPQTLPMTYMSGASATTRYIRPSVTAPSPHASPVQRRCRTNGLLPVCT